MVQGGGGEVGGRAAEHVGEDDDALAIANVVDGFHDILATSLDIVFGADRYGGDLVLRSHDVFEGRTKLIGQAAMSNDDEPDHFLCITPGETGGKRRDVFYASPSAGR